MNFLMTGRNFHDPVFKASLAPSYATTFDVNAKVRDSI